MTDKTLILTVGLPRSGKTTWARKQGYPIVCPDSIRLALHGERYIQLAEPFVWAIARTMVRALFLAGHDTVILDATNTTVKSRTSWVSPDWKLRLAPILATTSVCLARAMAEGDAYIVPIIQRMSEQLEALTIEELGQVWRSDL